MQRLIAGTIALGPIGALAEDVVGIAAPAVGRMIGQLARPAAGSGRTSSGAAWNPVAGSENAYSVAFETRLPRDAYPGRSRAYHFQRANDSLVQAMDADPNFAAAMESLIPDLRVQLVGPRGGISRQPPQGWTWHHATEPGVMQLVPEVQHTAPALRHLFHPGGRGGYSLWGR